MLEITGQDRLKNTYNTWTKHKPQKNKQHKTQQNKLPWFSHLLWHSARKRGGLILQCSRDNRGHDVPSRSESAVKSSKAGYWRQTGV